MSAAAVLGFTALGGAALAQTKGSPEHIKATIGAIDSAAITANTATSKDWPTYGLDYAETRFSKLNQINADNVKDIGLKWTYSLESIRGVEATPLGGRRYHVCQRVLERRPCRRCAHRQAALDL
jgi:quinohemoprotein ethanol dehydrogenase